jgi:hypothetical protein
VAIEEGAEKPVEVGGDALDVWSLRHAHPSIVPIASVIGSRPREMKREAAVRPGAASRPATPAIR